jgi:Cu-processing system permease protein
MVIKPTGVLVIARLTFREASRRWVLWAALLLGLLFLAVFALGYYELNKEALGPAERTNILLVNEFNNFIVMAGLYAVNFLTMIMTVLTSVDTISGEIASGTIHTLISKPIRRWEIILGKWMGFIGMLTLYLFLMAGGVIGISYLVGGYIPKNAFLGLGLMWADIILLLSVSLMGGTILSTLANGVLVFGLYSVAFIGGWIEQFGALMKSQVAVNIGIVSSLIIPSDAIWRRAAYEMQTPVTNILGYSPFSAMSVPSPAMVIYALIYALVMLILAVRYFRYRDL